MANFWPGGALSMVTDPCKPSASELSIVDELKAFVALHKSLVINGAPRFAEGLSGVHASLSASICTLVVLPCASVRRCASLIAIAKAKTIPWIFMDDEDYSTVANLDDFVCCIQYNPSSEYVKSRFPVKEIYAACYGTHVSRPRRRRR